MIIKIFNLVVGLAFTFAIPLGLLKLGILWADYQEKSNNINES